MKEIIVTQRPDWWRPGMPLPHLYAQSRIVNKDGARETTPVRWETVEEWTERNGGWQMGREMTADEWEQSPETGGVVTKGGRWPDHQAPRNSDSSS